MCDGFRRPRSCGGGDVVLTWVMLWSGPADTTLVSLPDTFTVVEGESERLNSSSGRRRCRGIPTNGRRQQLSSGVDVAITQTVITRLRSTRLTAALLHFNYSRFSPALQHTSIKYWSGVLLYCRPSSCGSLTKLIPKKTKQKQVPGTISASTCDISMPSNL